MTEGIVGVDEAGRGPVLGPLVVAAVRIADGTDLTDLQLRDSKELAADRRQRLDEAIRDRAEIELAVAAPADVDDACSKRSLNDLELDLFARAAGRLDAARVVADACDPDADRFRAGLAERLDAVDIRAEHGADARHPIVSAASIVAKVARDARIEALGEKVGADVGSGYPSDPRTRAFLEDWVRTRGDLPPGTRRSWRTARRVLGDHAQQSLADY